MHCVHAVVGVVAGRRGAAVAAAHGSAVAALLLHAAGGCGGCGAAAALGEVGVLEYALQLVVGDLQGGRAQRVISAWGCCAAEACAAARQPLAATLMESAHRHQVQASLQPV